MNQFVTDHPFLCFLALVGVYNLLWHILVIPNRIIRHFNIRKAGWPPKHLDADGDIQEKKEEEP